MKNTKFKFWHDFTIESNFSINKISLKNDLTKFWVSIMNPLEDNQVVYVFLKAKFSDGSIASLSHLQTVNKNMFKELLLILEDYLDLKAENYNNKTISQIIFQYHICTVNNRIKKISSIRKS
jgi:hypothetical protein